MVIQMTKDVRILNLKTNSRTEAKTILLRISDKENIMIISMIEMYDLYI
jgi:hypothetical protein